jgi:hypothetical protein
VIVRLFFAALFASSLVLAQAKDNVKLVCVRGRERSMYVEPRDSVVVLRVEGKPVIVRVYAGGTLYVYCDTVILWPSSRDATT